MQLGGIVKRVSYVRSLPDSFSKWITRRGRERRVGVFAGIAGGITMRELMFIFRVNLVCST